MRELESLVCKLLVACDINNKEVLTLLDLAQILLKNYFYQTSENIYIICLMLAKYNVFFSKDFFIFHLMKKSDPVQAIYLFFPIINS